MERSFIELFEEQVVKTPGNIAVVFEKDSCSYQELNERSNSLAHFLRSNGVTDESLVPLYMERSINMIVGMLGIMKAGAAYVPIDTDFPVERIDFMLKDTAAPVLVCSEKTGSKLTGIAAIKKIAIDAINNQPLTNLPTRVLPAQLAYVIYTSGSTGTPKGVMIEHRNLADYLAGLCDHTPILQCQSFALVSTIATDLGNTVIYGSLAFGGTLHLFTKESVSNIEYLHRYFSEHTIDCLKIVPSHWKVLKSGDDLLLPARLIIFGGEALPEKTVADIQASGATCTIVNHYGPTETTIGKLLYVVQPGSKHEYTIPIGKPFSNTKVLVLTNNLKLCPIGVPGQLYITGDGLARGYLNNPGLTNEKFIQNPFSKKTGSRMYSTGDLVKYLPDGNILFIGRVDNQVKIRGYRIELGEIENMLQQSPLVSQAVVLAKEDKQGNKRLVGYIVPGEDFDREGILFFIKEKLPDYMVPGILVEMQNLPLTSNGKVDRKALPDPEEAGTVSGEYIAPRNETETTLANLWQDVLEVDQVGMNDDFFELGGHSLLAVRLVSAIRKSFQVEMPIGDIFDYPTVALLAKQIPGQSATPVMPVIKKVTDPPQRIPLSFSQERIWFIHQLAGSLEYHMPYVMRLTGVLNSEALTAAIKNTVHRHEILRTVYLEQDGEPYQLVKTADDFNLLKVDGQPFVNDEPGLKKYIRQQVDLPFDLAKDFMLRAVLISLATEDHVLLVTLHHIASDGWSRHILVNDIAESYNAFKEGRKANLAELPLQYSDYAIWQQAYLQGDTLNNKISYWTNQLTDVAVLDLPIDFPRPAIQSTRGANESFYLDKELSAALQSFSQQQGSTLFMTLLTTFKVLLYRYSGQTDICVGTPIAGRQQQEVEGLIGFFINTLALRTQVDGESSFTDILQQVRKVTLEAYEHQEAPFEKVVEAVVKHRDLVRSPLFQVMFVLQNVPDAHQLHLHELMLSGEASAGNHSKFDLSFYLTETPEGCYGTVEYCTDLFRDTTIRQLITHFKTLLAAIIKSPGNKIGQLPMLNYAAEQQVLGVLSGKQASYPLNKNLVELFEEQVSKTPGSIALIEGDLKVTYQQLEDQSNRFAHYLAGMGVTPGTLVPVCLERSIGMITAILGVLKAGATYIPIDSSYPIDRVCFMLEDSKAGILIAGQDIENKAGNGAARLQAWKLAGGNIINLENELWNNQSPGKLPVHFLPGQPACIIYTSGTSGQPKGVQLAHVGIVNRLCWMWETFPFEAGEKNAIKTSIGFVDHIWEIFGALNHGVPSVIFLQETLLDLDRLVATLSGEKITRWVLVPSLLRTLLDKLKEDQIHLPHLKYWTSSGEKLPADLVTEFYTVFSAGQHILLNIYGSSEVTADVSWYDTSLAKGALPASGSVPIGRPLSNTRLYIMDANGRLVPPGISGEICVGGVQVAMGYLNLPELTAEKFVPDPFDETGGTMFKTGDLGRLLPDGNITYLGRLDEQVKIRGNRVEPAEIEAALKAGGLVQQSVVVPVSGLGDSVQLVAYFVAETTINHIDLIASLQAKLPDYMIPSAWLQLPTLPLMPNGKIDKRSLPAVLAGGLERRIYTPPSNETQSTIAAIWQQLLKKERIGIHDHFFESGGHSLIAMRVVSAIRKQLDVTLSIRDLFAHPTIASLATTLGQQENAAQLPSIALQSRPEKIPLSFSQERLWFIDKLEGTVQYHLPVVLRLKGELNAADLSQSLQAIVDRHESLRTVIVEADGHAYQLIQDAGQWRISSESVAAYNASELALKIQTIINAPFNLASDFMLRATLLVINPSEHLLIVTMHHIASDGWSMSVLVKEVTELYSAFDEVRAPVLNPLPVQYADYAVWQRNYLKDDILRQKIGYWKNKLDGVTPLQLPADYTRPATRSNAGARISFQVSGELSARLHSFSRQQDATLFMTLLSAFKVLLYRYTGQEDICVGTPVANRNTQELEELIGFFVNTLAIRSTVSETSSFTSLVQQLKTTLLEAYEHQDTPFEKVVDAVVKERDLGRTPVFQVMFVLQNIPGGDGIKVNKLLLSKEEAGHHISKFDITLTINETAGGLNASLDYSTALFKEATMRKMVAHFEALLAEVVRMPAQAIATLPMLSKAEEKQLLVDFNDSSVAYPKEKTIVHLFEEQAEIHPGKIAIECNGQQFTYDELNSRSNQLANYLRNKGVNHESLVPLFFTRSADMIIALLAILKAGAAYVPVDPEYPAERIAFMLEDTGATLVLTNNISSTSLGAFTSLEVIDINALPANTDQQFLANPDLALTPKSLAYVIYTSGSTGKPKGVMIEHQALLDHCFGVIKSANLSECASFALFAPLVFDAGHSLIHASFILGAHLHVLSKELLDDGPQLAAYITHHDIDCVKIVPSLWLSYADAGSVILAKKIMIFGGDAFSVNVLGRLSKLAYKGKVFNHYGPTEATIGKTIHTVDLNRQYSIIPIGKPFSNTSVYITNRMLQLVPVGVAGELYIAGDGLARGYLNNPVLTAEKFITNPFAGANGHKTMYRTGDQARWLPDGNIEYLGRIDEQVKIRGFRIEPGEIEIVLKESGLVQQSVVLPKEAASGNKLLVAYIVTEGVFNKEPIITYLKGRLPEYMIPSFWISLPALPLTSNGKIDRKALPDPVISSSLADQYVAPRNTIEQDLADTWQALLGVERVGVHDNFFDLGGDSIITIQAVSRARQKGYEFRVGDIFTTQTVAKLAALIEQKKFGELVNTGEQGILTGEAGLLPAQQRFFEKAPVNVHHFNQAILLQVDKGIDAARLSQAIQQLSKRHDALRFRYSKEAGKWIQKYGDHEVVLSIEDITGVPGEQVAAAITELSSGHQRSLNIVEGPIAKLVWIQTPVTDTHNRLLFVIHHLAIDGVSWRVLLEDLELLLTPFVTGAEVTPAAKTSSYRQWYNALEQFGRSSRMVSQAVYWQNIVSSYLPLPVDVSLSKVTGAAARAGRQVRLDAIQTRRLVQEASTLYHTDINDLLLSALYLTLSKWSAAGKIVIGLEGHGRQPITDDIDTTRTVGWFTSHYPLLLQVTGEMPSIAGAIKSVKEQLRQVPDKGIGYGVLRYINKDTALQGREPWDIVFNYLGQLDNVLKEGTILKPAPESAGSAVDEHYQLAEKLTVSASIQNGELQLSWTFSARHYTTATIAGLSDDYMKQLRAIIEHCTDAAHICTQLTPSDYGLGAVASYQELDRFLEETINGKTRRESIASLYTLSGLQQGLFFHSLYETGFGTYVHQFGCDLVGVDVEVFIKSWNRVISHHSVLRTAFYHDNFAVPIQTVATKIELPVTSLDLRHLSADKQQAAINDFKYKDRHQSFDYKTAPLMRLALVQLSDARYRMMWTWHHLLFDGWSMPILMEEFLTTYESLVNGIAPVTPEEDRYEDYIRYIQNIDKEKEEAYWRKYLKPVEENTLLPFIASGNERNKGAGEYKTLAISIDSKDTAIVQNFAQQNRITLNTVMQGVWACLLHQYTGNDKVMYGIIVSGRPEDLPGVEKRVGLYINAVPLYTSISNANNIIEWLQGLQVEQVSSRQYQYTALSDIQRWTGIQGDLFDNLLVFDNYPVSKVIGEQTWSLKVERAELHEQNNYPLSIVIISNPDAITIQFLYNAALIREEYMEGVGNHFRHVLMQVATNEVRTIGDISFLTKAEENQLLAEFNDAANATVKHPTIVELFEAQANKTPGATALVYKNDELTFGQLNEYSNRLAHFLRDRGVKENVLVPICIEKSFGMMVAVLGILKAGGAYVPIDPDYPGERVKYILEDTGAAMLLTSPTCRAKLPSIPGIDIIEMKEDMEGLEKQSVSNIKSFIAPEHLAYIIYTSGSTGNPKGVMVQHSNLVHYLLNNHTRYVDESSPCAGSFIHLSYTFDASLTAMFMPLLAGKLVVIGSRQSVEVFEDSNLWKYAPYDFLKITPAHLELLQHTLRNEAGDLLTNRLVIGGEALNAGHFRYLVEKNINVEIINEYGPTETTVGCTIYSFKTVEDAEEVSQFIPIGKPIENTGIYIVNKSGDMVPVGVTGEICISGNGVAKGYLNLPGLTAEKFIENKFAQDSGGLMYRSGDLGRWLPDGNIEYQGRVDDQVKINGYRIELGEIESVICSMEGVRNARLLVKESAVTGDKKLNAYVQLDKEQWPLVNNYLSLVNTKMIRPEHLNILPNGLPVISPNLNEVRFLYKEIFEDHCYLKHGISLNENSCVVDIGANVGFFTVFLNILSKNIKVYSVEPIPDVYNSLVANRKLYDIKGKAFQLAVSDKEGEVDFTWYPQVTIVSGMSQELNKVNEVVRSYIENSKTEDYENAEIDSMLKVKLETRQIRCKTKTLSAIIEEERIEKIDLLKVDVENSEHLVMNGISDKDWEKIGSVIIEVHDVNGRLAMIGDTLTQKGFTTYIEKEQMLSKDDVLYNLFAIKEGQSKELVTLGDKGEKRSGEWMDPAAFIGQTHQQLQQRLPAYMVPANIVLMDEFPLTKNGKIDKQAFPEVPENGVATEQFLAPRNELEEKLAAIWMQILEVDTIGIQDDFFALGGDSLLSIRLISSIRRDLDVELPISTFFELITIEKVANYIRVNHDDFQVQLEDYDEIKL